MKILVIGAAGFVGNNVAQGLEDRHEVYRASRKPETKDNIYIDLLKPETILAALQNVQPDVIIQCAGIVENIEAASENPVFTGNLLDQVVALGTKPKIIISGSAAEYGLVDPEHIPVSEDTPLKATSIYGLSKIEETKLALKARAEHGLTVVVARIFNPIGVGMQPKFLTSRIMQQIKEIKSGERQAIEVSRLDSKRDYIDVHDLAAAFRALVEGTPEQEAYNIGSGKATTNGELIDLFLAGAELPAQPNIVETMEQPEPLVATQADITRLQQEFGWSPSVTLEVTVKEIVDAAN